MEPIMKVCPKHPLGLQICGITLNGKFVKLSTLAPICKGGYAHGTMPVDDILLLRRHALGLCVPWFKKKKLSKVFIIPNGLLRGQIDPITYSSLDEVWQEIDNIDCEFDIY